MCQQEPNEELIARYKHVCQIYYDAIKRRNKARTGRDRLSRFAGSINFAKLGIESLLRDRGLEHITE